MTEGQNELPPAGSMPSSEEVTRMEADQFLASTNAIQAETKLKEAKAAMINNIAHCFYHIQSFLEVAASKLLPVVEKAADRASKELDR